MLVTFVAWAMFVWLGISLAKTGHLHFNAAGITVVTGIIGLAFKQMWAVSYIVEAATGSDAYYKQAGGLIGVPGTGFCLCAALTVALMWMQIARATRAFRSTSHHLERKTQIAVTVTCVSFMAILLILGIALPRSTAVLAVLIVFIVVVVVVYIVGSHKLVKQVGGASGSMISVSKKLKVIVHTARLAIGMGVSIIAAAIITVLFRLLRVNSKGAGAAEIIVYALFLQVPISIFLLSIARYILRSTASKRGFRGTAIDTINSQNSMTLGATGTGPVTSAVSSSNMDDVLEDNKAAAAVDNKEGTSAAGNEAKEDKGRAAPAAPVEEPAKGGEEGA